MQKKILVYLFALQGAQIAAGGGGGGGAKKEPNLFFLGGANS